MTDQQKEKHVTVVGTDINEVKEQNAHSGLTYNEVKQLLAEHYVKQNNSFDQSK